MHLPPFIEMDGDPQFPPPYVFQNVVIRSFRLSADLEVLTALCDKLLNIGTFQERGFEYRPILPFVDLEVLTYPFMKSRVSRFYNMGYTNQNEVYFRLLLGKFENVLGFLAPTGVAVFMPYIFVDNAWSLISGREVIGYPKALASFNLANPGPYPMSMTTDVFEQYDPATPQTRRKLMKISQAGTPQAGLQGFTAWPWGVLDFGIFDQALIPLLQSVLQGSSFPTIQLKQIRDAESAQRACYQALVQAEFQVTRIDQPSLLPSAEIRIPHYDSLPIVNELGLGTGPLHPLWQYSLTCDLEFLNTYNLFVRP